METPLQGVVCQWRPHFREWLDNEDPTFREWLKSVRAALWLGGQLKVTFVSLSDCGAQHDPGAGGWLQRHRTFPDSHLLFSLRF